MQVENMRKPGREAAPRGTDGRAAGGSGPSGTDTPIPSGSRTLVPTIPRGSGTQGPTGPTTPGPTSLIGGGTTTPSANNDSGSTPSSINPTASGLKVSFAVNPLFAGKTPEQIERIRQKLTAGHTSAAAVTPATRCPGSSDKAAGPAAGKATKETGPATALTATDEAGQSRDLSLATECSRLRTTATAKLRSRSACARWLKEEGWPGLTALTALIFLFLYLVMVLVLHVTSIADVLVDEGGALLYVGVTPSSQVAMGILVSILLFRILRQFANLTCWRHKLHAKAIEYTKALPSRKRKRFVRSSTSTGSAVMEAPIYMIKTLCRMRQWQKVSSSGRSQPA